MSTKIDHLRALSRVCRQFGGRLVILSQAAFDRQFDGSNADLSSSPFTEAHGIWWRRKIVYAVRGREEVGSIIHEMGHVFAADHHPDHDCAECREWNWFGWEIAVARQIGAGRQFSRSNATYKTGEDGGSAWGKITPEQRRAVVSDRLAHAKKIGVVTTDGSPWSLR